MEGIHRQVLCMKGLLWFAWYSMGQQDALGIPSQSQKDIDTVPGTACLIL